MGPQTPRRLKLRPTRQYGEDGGGGALVKEEREKLQRRRIHPVQVFDNQDYGVLGGTFQGECQEHFEGTLLLPLGRQGEWLIAFGRYGRGGGSGREGDRLVQGGMIL